MEEIENLKDLCKPLVAFLKKNYHPYARIEISDTAIKVIEETKSIPTQSSKGAGNTEELKVIIKADTSELDTAIEKAKELTDILHSISPKSAI